MWKKIILGVVAVIIIAVVLALVFTKSLTEVANKQLEALRKGDITTAYTYTSKDFQANTPIHAFQRFVNQHDALKNNQKANWDSREISNNIGTLTGSLVATNGAVTPVEYRFVKENDEWKILSIITKPSGIQPAAQHDAQTTSGDISWGEIHRIVIGDAYDTKAKSIVEPKTVISTHAPKVFVSVYVLHAKAGLKVTAEMVRLENGAKIGPSHGTITQSGNVIRDFSFTNVSPTWPAGDYRINVATSNGQASSFDFKIE